MSSDEPEVEIEEPGDELLIREPDVVPKLPIEKIAEIRRNALVEAKAIKAQSRFIDPKARRAYGTIMKLCEAEIACELREWLAGLVKPALNDAMGDIEKHGFSATSQDHLSSIAVVMAISGNNVESLQKGLTRVGEFSGILKEGPNKAIKITGEQLGAVVQALVAPQVKDG